MSTPTSDRGVLSAVLRKELREGLKWGVIGLGISAVALTMLVRTLAGPEGSMGFGDAPSIMSVYPFSCAVAPLVALLIGLGQILPENRGDNWGFLVHRPAQRSTLFWGKALSGMLLYTLAFGIPMACAVVWTAIPGHLPTPFDARMALPAIADLACGIVFYFAALLVGMREGRWYGSRALGVGLAIVCWHQVTGDFSPTFGLAIAWCIAGAGILCTAAWGTFIRGGQYGPQPTVARAAVGLSTVAGLAVVGGVALTIVLTLPMFSRGASDFTYTDYGVTHDGHVVQITQGGRMGEVVSVKDLDGRADPQFADPESRNRRSITAGVVSGSVGLQPPAKGDHFIEYRETDAVFQQLGVDNPGAPNTVNWFYMNRERLIAAYDLRTARLVGWLGPDGFSTGVVPPATRFDGPLEHPSDVINEFEGLFGMTIRQNVLTTSLISFPTAVYHVDLIRRRIERVFTAQAGDTVVGAVAIAPNPYEMGPDDASASSVVTVTNMVEIPAGALPPGAMMSAPPPQMVAPQSPLARFSVVATTRQIYLLSQGGAPPTPVARDTAAAGYGQLRVSRATLAPGSPTFLRYEPWSGTRPFSEWGKLPAQMTEVSLSGAPIASLALPPRHTPEPILWGRVVAEAIAQPVIAHVAKGLWRPVAQPSPPLMMLAMLLQGPSNPDDESAGQTGTVSWIVTLLVALVCACFMYVRGKQYAFPPHKLWLWVALGIALGPLGVLLMLSVIEWPARETCPSCGKQRVVTNDRCEHCGGTFAAPRPDGTEIFEPLTVTASVATS